MLHILICAMLATALPGTALSGTALSGTVGTHAVAPTGLTVQPAPDDAGDPPRPRTGRFGWPLKGPPVVTRAFQAPAAPFGPGHRGVDLVAVAGAPVFAAGDGTVVFAGTVAGRGVVSVDHPGGLRTTYEPVSAAVTAGDRVTRGERLGTVQPGHPGCTVAACLHWGVLRIAGPDRDYLDPLLLVMAARVRLLPLDDQPDRR
ncbi:MAG: M23 family metallopeptidase [Pseudonocardiaceae bacterium]